jgi:hypothetical protein
VETRIDEIQGLGEDYLEAFTFFAPWLEDVSNGVYREHSLWYELAAAKSVHTLYQLSKLTSTLPHIIDRQPATISYSTFIYPFVRNIQSQRRRLSHSTSAA